MSERFNIALIHNFIYKEYRFEQEKFENGAFHEKPDFLLFKMNSYLP